MKLKILGIKPAVSKADKVYYKVSTDKGSNFTAFDEAIVGALTDACANEIEINLNVVPSADGKWQNIRGFAMDDDVEAIEEDDGEIHRYPIKRIKPQEFGKEVVEDAFMGHRKSVKDSAYEKDPVGLAVEVFVAIVDEKQEQTKVSMQSAIELVKQAQEAFK